MCVYEIVTEILSSMIITYLVCEHLMQRKRLSYIRNTHHKLILLTLVHKKYFIRSTGNSERKWNLKLWFDIFPGSPRKTRQCLQGSFFRLPRRCNPRLFRHSWYPGPTSCPWSKMACKEDKASPKISIKALSRRC